MTVTLYDLFVFSRREFRCSFEILNGAALNIRFKIVPENIWTFADPIRALRTLTVKVINDGTDNKDCYDEGQNSEHDVVSIAAGVFSVYKHFRRDAYLMMHFRFMSHIDESLRNIG